MHHIELTIRDFQAKLSKAQAEVTRYKKTINDLCEMAGREPMYAVTEETEEAKAAVPSSFASDAFYGKPLASGIKLILDQRRARNSGPASVDDIYNILLAGGYHFEGKEENRKTILRTAIRKNSDFHKLPNGLIGLSSWYERIKKSGGHGSFDDDGDLNADQDSSSEEDQSDQDMNT